ALGPPLRRRRPDRVVGCRRGVGSTREPPGWRSRHHRRPGQCAGQHQPGRPGGDPPQPQYPAHPDQPPRPAGAAHRQPRPGVAALPTNDLPAGDYAMTTNKLRLGPLPKTKTVKLTFACPASLKEDLEWYAELHGQTYGEMVDAVTLIPHMLEAFMARDRGFRRKRGKVGSPPIRADPKGCQDKAWYLK